MSEQNILRLNVARVREQLSELLNLAKYKQDRIEITKRDKTIAYIISKEDFDLLERIEDYLDGKEADEIMKKSYDNISHEQLKKEFGFD